MLSSFDDYPLHQVIEPLRIPGTTDQNFSTASTSTRTTAVPRWPSSPGWVVIRTEAWSMHSWRCATTTSITSFGQAGHLVPIAPTRRWRNIDRGRRGIEDASADVRSQWRRRRIGPDLDRCDTGTRGAAARTGAGRQNRHGHVPLHPDGNWHRAFAVADRTFDVAPDSWLGIRDRSWGVRPIGTPDTGGIDAAAPPAGYLWNWVPMQFADRTIVFAVQEDSAGNRSVDEAVLVPTDPAASQIDLGAAQHDWTFVPGTRQVAAGVVSFPQSRGELTSGRG